MIYSFTLSIFDIVAFVAAVFVLGVMAGHKLLPPPFDKNRELLITRLFTENMALKMGLEIPNDRVLSKPVIVKGKTNDS